VGLIKKLAERGRARVNIRAFLEHVRGLGLASSFGIPAEKAKRRRKPKAE
jgi:hypothetical protein